MAMRIDRVAIARGSLDPHGHTRQSGDGPLPWCLPDGTDPVAAQRMVRVAVTLLSSRVEVARRLGVGEEAIEYYMQSAVTIPRHIGREAARLLDALRREVKTEAMRSAEAAVSRSQWDVGDVVNYRDERKGASARECFRRDIAVARRRRGWQYKDVAERLGLGCMASTMERAEHDGLTPVSIWYKPLCKLYGLDPAGYDWSGHLGTLAAAPDDKPVTCGECEHYRVRYRDGAPLKYGECVKWIQRKRQGTLACEAFSRRGEDREESRQC